MANHWKGGRKKAYQRAKAKHGEFYHRARLCAWRDGLNPEEVVTYLEKHSTDPCHICGKTANPKKLHNLDHNHVTKTIRGILCHNCNVGLGNFKDSPIFIMKALDYLIKDDV